MMEQSAERALLQSFLAFGNPSSIHASGRRAKALVDDAREQLAQAFGISDPDELLFTGSATEATNTALKGLFQWAKKEGRDFHLLTSAVEHEATLETARFLESEGARVEVLSVDGEGRLDLEGLEQCLKRRAKESLCLVSLMAANNETGVIFPWAAAARMAREFGALFHLDAVQAPGKQPDFSLADTAVDLASFSAHKIGGIKGVGALYVRKGLKLVSLLHGGAQERKRRAGTLNVPGIVSFGAAAAALSERSLGAMESLRNELETSVRERIEGVTVLGAGASRIVNTSNLLFDGVRGEGLVMGLDLEGFAVSSGSACNSGSILPSHVLLAMGFDKSAAQSAVRVSLGPQNTLAEIHAFTEALEKVVRRIRTAGTRA